MSIVDKDKHLQNKKYQEEELIKKAEIVYEHQKKQYELSVDGLRRLEDKAMKIFSVLSFVITITLLIIRYWWADLFPKDFSPLHVLCWMALLLFIFMVMISWGFTFSAMQPKDFERPSSDADKVEQLFMNHPRYNSLTSFAREYSRLTETVDRNHVEKVKLIIRCSEAMMYSAWVFVFFIISFVIIKIGR